jgi:hypothetical protein
MGMSFGDYFSFNEVLYKAKLKNMSNQKLRQKEQKVFRGIVAAGGTLVLACPFVATGHGIPVACVAGRRLSVLAQKQKLIKAEAIARIPRGYNPFEPDSKDLAIPVAVIAVIDMFAHASYRHTICFRALRAVIRPP